MPRRPPFSTVWSGTGDWMTGRAAPSPPIRPGGGTTASYTAWMRTPPGSPGARRARSRRRTSAGCRSRPRRASTRSSTASPSAAWVDQEGTITAADNFATALSRQIGTSEDQYYHLSLLLGRPTLFITTDVGYVAPGAPDTIPRDTWVHLAGMYDGAMARPLRQRRRGDERAADRQLRSRHDARHPGRQRQRRQRRPDRAVPRPRRRAHAVLRAR